MGRKGSAKLRNGVSSLSSARVTRSPSIELVYHTKSFKLDVPGLGTFAVAKPPRNSFPVGETFMLEIPDHPHRGGLRYTNRATFATSWFRIVDPKVPDRYLHTGKFSAGCSTVSDAWQWDGIYRFLINRRLDKQHVGKLRVVDS